jgi:hypothetical protein
MSCRRLDAYRSRGSFSSLHDDQALDILAGVQRRSGRFTEIKLGLRAKRSPAEFCDGVSILAGATLRLALTRLQDFSE